MKKIIYLFTILFLFSSCSPFLDIQKRKYMPGFYVHTGKNIKKVRENDFVQMADSNTALASNEIEKISFISTSENISTLIKKTVIDCDEIILRNGDIIKGKVTKIGISEIEYKHCDNTDSPIIVLPKSDVFMIRYANGTKDVFKEEEKEEDWENYNPPPPPPPQQPVLTGDEEIDYPDAKDHGLAVAGMILGIVSLVAYYGSFLFGLLAIIFGSIAKDAIDKNPKKHKGKKMANAAIVLGIITIALWLFIILLLSSMDS